MARYQVEFWSHWLDNKGELTNPLFSQIDIVYNYSLFGAFIGYTSNKLKTERTNKKAVVQLAVRNWDMKQNGTLRYYPKIKYESIINPNDNDYKREFYVHGVYHNKGGISVIIRADDIFQALVLFCKHANINLSKTDSFDLFDSFTIWEENWRIS